MNKLLTNGLPKRLNSKMPIIDSSRSFHRDVLSPSQCPPYFAVPGKLERPRVNDLLPVAASTALSFETILLV